MKQKLEGRFFLLAGSGSRSKSDREFDRAYDEREVERKPSISHRVYGRWVTRTPRIHSLVLAVRCTPMANRS